MQSFLNFSITENVTISTIQIEKFAHMYMKLLVCPIITVHINSNVGKKWHPETVQRFTYSDTLLGLLFSPHLIWENL